MFQPLDIPIGETVLSGGTDDPVEIVVGRARRWARGGDVTQGRYQGSIGNLDQDRLGQVCATEPVLAVQAAKFGMCGLTDDAVDAVPIRPHQPPGAGPVPAPPGS